MAKVREKGCFIRSKGVGPSSVALYLWCPDTELSKGGYNTGKQPAAACTATKGSQGYDNITGYVYQMIVVNGMQQNSAYVECNYVQ